MDYFNNSLKESFLLMYANVSTVKNYSRLFRVTGVTEDLLGKDLGEFNQDEIEALLKNTIKPSTQGSARTTGRMITKYLDFAVEEGLRDDNYLAEQPSKYFYNFISKKSNEFIHAEDILEISTKTLINAQDGAIIQLIFEGAQGSGVSELCNLHLDDVNLMDKVVTLRDDSKSKKKQGTNVRTISVTENAIQLIKLAASEKIYEKKNGDTDDLPNNVKATTELAETPYVFKTAKTYNTDSEDKVKKYTIYNRLDMARNVAGLEEYSELLNVKSIAKSGMVYMGYQLYKRDGEFGLAQMKEVCEQFGIAYKWSVRDYLNLDNIKSLYIKG
ncbi:phage lytic cycle repressor MrpR family protein [Halobacillus faecis]